MASLISRQAASDRLFIGLSKLQFGSDYCLTKLDHNQTVRLLDKFTEFYARRLTIDQVFPELTSLDPVASRNSRSRRVGHAIYLPWALGCEKLSDDVKRLLETSNEGGWPSEDGVTEVMFLAYLILGRKMRVFGLLIGSHFYVMWVDPLHRIWNDRKLCPSQNCEGCQFSRRTESS